MLDFSVHLMVRGRFGEQRQSIWKLLLSMRAWIAANRMAAIVSVDPIFGRKDVSMNIWTCMHECIAVRFACFHTLLQTAWAQAICKSDEANFSALQCSRQCWLKYMLWEICFSQTYNPAVKEVYLNEKLKRDLRGRWDKPRLRRVRDLCNFEEACR